MKLLIIFFLAFAACVAAKPHLLATGVNYATPAVVAPVVHHPFVAATAVQTPVIAAPAYYYPAYAASFATYPSYAAVYPQVTVGHYFVRR